MEEITPKKGLKGGFIVKNAACSSFSQFSPGHVLITITQMFRHLVSLKAFCGLGKEGKKNAKL